MKTAAQLVAAGGTFAAAVVAGMAVGVWLAHGGQRPGYVVAGFFAGVALGGYAFYRMVSRSLA